MIIKQWLAGVSALALLVPASAMADATDAARSPVLEEIIVTAQKVRTDAQKTPVAIQIVPGQAITAAGVDNAKDLNRLVSALSVQVSAGGGSSFYIRGVGSDNGNAFTDNGIAVNLDQIYFSRAYGPDLAFYDLERIEVLKGPQGTLYGRNATGGVINIVTSKPVLERFDGYARLELGNYGEVRANAAVNVPVSDTIAARVAIQTNQHNGYLTDGYDDNRTRGIRGHVLWKPTSAVSLLVSAEYDHAGGKGDEAVPLVNNAFLTANPYLGGESPEIMAYIASLAQNSPRPTNVGNPAHLFSAPQSCYPGCLPPGFIQANANTAFHPYQVTDAGYVNTTIKSLRSDLEWNLGFGTLSVVPGLLNTDYDTLFYNGASPYYNNGAARQLSLEVRLASPQDQRFTWLAGLFGEREKERFTFMGTFGAPLAYQRAFEPDITNRAGGIFAQASFKVVPTLILTAGARYSIEDKVSYNAVADNAGLFPSLAVYSVAPKNQESSSSPTYRLGADWQVARDNLLYASFATGFHSGGLQLGQPPVRPICVPVLHGTVPQFLASVSGCDAAGTFKPEHLTAYTVGSKNRFFGNRLQINLEAYDWEYKDLQVGTLGLSNPGQTNQVVTNAGSARIYGLDVEARAQLTRNDEFGISLNYNHSRYGFLEFYSYVVGPPFPPNISVLTGQPFLGAPDLTFTSYYHHDFLFADGARLTPSIALQYSSEVLFSLVPQRQSQPEYYKIDLGLTYHARNDRFEIGLFARNVNNVATLNSSGGLDSTSNLPYVRLSAPRTFGGSVQINFGGK